MALNSQSPADAALNREESVVTEHQEAKLKQEYDVEGQPRRDSRIAPVQAEDRTSIGKQLELEAENAIKYRTCSWQKVRLRLDAYCSNWLTQCAVDCRPALLRVHLLGHDVVPVVILRPGPGAWSHPDSVHRCCRALHVADYLVCI